MKFGLALSGGALRGAAHIGVLKALHEHKLYPSMIAGTSAGSMVGALYACGYTPSQMEKIALKLNSSIFDTDFSGIVTGAVQWLLTRNIGLSGIIKGNRLEMLFKELTHSIKMKDVKMPLAITAVNINNGSSVIFTNRNIKIDKKDSKYILMDDVYLCEAVRASTAIPVVFRPKMINKMRLVDGGLTDILPLTALKLLGAPVIIGINLGYSGQMRHEVDNILEIGNQSIDIMGYHITKLKSGLADLIINPHIFDVGLTEFDKIPQCIEKGYKCAIDNMDLIKRTINSYSSTPPFYKNLR